ncbi:MAG: hypothetical protein QXD03_01795 [Candidatus Anstonellales archaeon]
MLVRLSSLPEEIRDKIPITMLLEKDEYDLKSLPPEIQGLIVDYLFEKPSDISYSGGLYDFRPKETHYNDLEPLDLKSTVLEYFRNYIATSKGSYPFDVTYGTEIKKYLQMKDLSLVKTLLSNELKNIVDALSNTYNIDVKILSSKIMKNDDVKANYAEYVLEVVIKIDNETFRVVF